MKAEDFNRRVPEPVTDLRERIARRICTLNPQVKSWDELDVFAQGAWLGEAAGLLALIKPEIDAARLGYMKLAEDQSLPVAKEIVFATNYYEAQQDMLKAGWRRVELADTKKVDQEISDLIGKIVREK